MNTQQIYFDKFDILFHDFFNTNSTFTPPHQSIKQSHPVNIFYNKEGLNFEIACTGLSRKDVVLSIEDDMLKISYDKPKVEEKDDSVSIYRGLSQRSFSLGYKISTKFNLQKTDAVLENGLLKISIPVSEQAKPKQLTIK